MAMNCPFCDNELHNHPAGKCLDDWASSYGFPGYMPSHTVAGAFDLVTYMKRKYQHAIFLSIWCVGAEWRVRWYDLDNNRWGSNALTVQLAITRASIEAMEHLEQARNGANPVPGTTPQANTVGGGNTAPAKSDRISQVPS